MKKKQNNSFGAAVSLSKYIAVSGVASRRKAVEIIEKGLVSVNGTVVKEPGYKIKTGDVVKAFEQVIKPEEKVYILLNKPKDYITTVADEKGRKTVMELIDVADNIRLYPVGRLDRSTTGLLLLTNDGDLAQELAHPKFEVSKVYHVTLDKILTHADALKLKKGVMLEDGFIAVDDMEFFADEPKSEVLVELHSGKYRIVRRLFEALGYDVKKLDRVMYAGLSLDGVKRGEWRYLTKAEVKTLKKDTIE